MIRKVKDYVAYGEVDQATVKTLLETRGRVTGDLPLTDEYIREHSTYSGIAEFANALSSGNARLTGCAGSQAGAQAPPATQGI